MFDPDIARNVARADRELSATLTKLRVGSSNNSIVRSL
jgi:hypothetical protein